MNASGTEEGAGSHRRNGNEDLDGGLPVVVPNRWQGDADCAVGPFSGRDVARYFASRVVDFGQYEVFSMRVFARRNAWYVEVRRRPPPR
ncbi:MAG TPA: hypothetical protein VKA00_04660 [Trueperaceae bacterium]|nr:hypothetical protein [Trueperaceae bacterium]